MEYYSLAVAAWDEDLYSLAEFYTKKALTAEKPLRSDRAKELKERLSDYQAAKKHHEQAQDALFYYQDTDASYEYLMQAQSYRQQTQTAGLSERIVEINQAFAEIKTEAERGDFDRVNTIVATLLKDFPFNQALNHWQAVAYAGIKLDQYIEEVKEPESLFEPDSLYDNDQQYARIATWFGQYKAVSTYINELEPKLNQVEAFECIINRKNALVKSVESKIEFIENETSKRIYQLAITGNIELAYPQLNDYARLVKAHQMQSRKVNDHIIKPILRLTLNLAALIKSAEDQASDQYQYFSIYYQDVLAAEWQRLKANLRAFIRIQSSAQLDKILLSLLDLIDSLKQFITTLTEKINASKNWQHGVVLFDELAKILPQDRAIADAKNLCVKNLELKEKLCKRLERQIETLQFKSVLRKLKEKQTQQLLTFAERKQFANRVAQKRKTRIRKIIAIVLTLVVIAISGVVYITL